MYSLGVDLTGAPLWADLAMRTPALALYLKETRDTWRDHAQAVASRLDPAEAQLRSVRHDLLDPLATPHPAPRRDARRHPPRRPRPEQRPDPPTTSRPLSGSPLNWPVHLLHTAS
ncbi:hypothetical protein GCM10010530_27250 [Kribbella aluminosa]